MDIATSKIIITGASSGIGLATARAAIKKGTQVALVARREDRLNALVADLGPNALAVPCDVTEAVEIRSAIDKVIAAFGRIDVLINNAGRGFYASIEEIDVAAYRTLLDLNTIAPLAMMQAVLPQMRHQGSGAIVNVSSGATFGVLPGAATYASSKSALNMLSDVARIELADIGIAVSTIYPFVTDTEFYEVVQKGEAAAEAELSNIGSAWTCPALVESV